MKNANVFVDVDLTLVDASGKLLEGAREGLQQLKDAGCHLFLWSTCGAEYCRKVAQLHGLTAFFEGFSAKPDIVIDDMPST
jgi:phosphoglycolate phosphatase-like HAD superfamily hydrolase